MPNHPPEHALGFRYESIRRDNCIQESIGGKLLNRVVVTCEDHFLSFRQSNMLLKKEVLSRSV